LEAGGGKLCLPLPMAEPHTKKAAQNKITLYRMAQNLHPIRAKP
jgi:hypothetical protein